MKKFIFGLLILTLASCKHKELIYEPEMQVNDIKVVFDWKRAPSASAGQMSVYLYPLSPREGEPTYYAFKLTNVIEDTISIPYGLYDIISYNSDAEGVATQGEYGFDSFCLMSEELSSIGVVWGDVQRDIEVSKAKNIITLTPAQIAKKYTIELKNVAYLVNASSFEGSISGMSREYIPSTAQATPVPVIISFPLSKKDETTLSGSFYAFGHCPMAISNTHTFSIRTVISDGSKREASFDITSKLHAADARTPFDVVVIIEEGKEFDISLWDSDINTPPSIDPWTDDKDNLPLN